MRADDPPGDAPPGKDAPTEFDELTTAEQAKLLRIAKMVRELQQEATRASVDEAGRALLRDIHDRAVRQIGALSAELRSELDQLTLPLEADVPSETEIRLAQAQLVGWLEGLFHGIQAAMLSRQLQQQQRHVQEQHAQQAAQPPREDARERGQYL